MAGQGLKDKVRALLAFPLAVLVAVELAVVLAVIIAPATQLL